ncbi:MAG: transcriptional regulator GcvA [Candidatus Pelagadaptatus aseana]|uniref:LysR family transcriptional regulator n=1 Tax=Candidatus Pelagadaptatus aseana TaxID=3120508 RepID=UPI0039B20A66
MNPPPIQWLPAFARAAEALSFRKAAEQLNVSPPAISQQIKALEDYLGVLLFKRHGPRLELTEAGEFYYGPVQDMLKIHQTGFEELDRRFNRRALTLNTPLFIAQEILIPNYMDYKQRQPNAELRITTGTEYIDFTANTADAAIRFGSGDWPTLASRLLCKTLTTPVCSLEYYQRHIPDDGDLFSRVNQQTLLTTNEANREWLQLFPEIEAREVIVCDSYFSVIKSAEKGLGIGLGLFPAINNWVNDRRLKTLTTDMFDTGAGYWLVHPKQRGSSELVESCFEWAKDLFETLPELSLPG